MAKLDKTIRIILDIWNFKNNTSTKKKNLKTDTQQSKNAFDWSAKYYIKLIIICSKKISLFAQLFVIVYTKPKPRKSKFI